MKKHLILGCLAAVIAAPAEAQQSTMDQVLQELRALNERVSKLEQDNGQLRTENEELRATNERMEATTEYLRDNASATRKQLAEEGPKVVEAERIAKAAEWASRISWKADMRYRHETVDPQEADEDQTRHRIRARFGLTGKINDTATGTIQIATNGANNDPRSTNQTLGEGNTRKGLGIDLAYVDWRPIEGLSLLAGKMPQPWQKVGSYFWDNDITPEGMAIRFTRGPFFANAYGMWLAERSTANDSTLLGGQLGLTGNLGAAKLTGAIGYYDFGSVQGQVTTTNTVPCVANPTFFGGPQGNTTVIDAAGCPTLVNDYNMIEALVQADMTLGTQPFSLFAHYMQNQEADDLDAGYAVGLNYGKASNPNTWEFGYAWQVTEKDAQLGQFVDSDFGGGVTDVEGGVLRVAYAPARNWVLNGTYFMNERFVDAPGANESNYDRYQLDLNYRF